MKWLMAVALSGMIVTSCAATYPYKFYALWLDKELLAGPTPDDDLPLDVCVRRGSCVVYQLEEHRRVRENYLKLAQENMQLKRKCGARCK